MATTALTIIEAAYARSTFNDPDKLATPLELVAVLDRRVKNLFSHAARINPFYFATTTTKTYSAPGWARPSDAEMIIKVENNSSGAEINVVPFEDKQADFAPRVYELGQVYRTVGLTDDPTTGDTLKFYYAKRPDSLTVASSTIDALWPEQFNDLLVLHIAKYLATKDARPEDVALLAAEEAALLETFSRHLAHENYAMKARFGHRARMVAPGPSGFNGE